MQNYINIWIIPSNIWAKTYRLGRYIRDRSENTFALEGGGAPSVTVANKREGRGRGEQWICANILPQVEFFLRTGANMEGVSTSVTYANKREGLKSEKKVNVLCERLLNAYSRRAKALTSRRPMWSGCHRCGPGATVNHKLKKKNIYMFLMTKSFKRNPLELSSESGVMLFWMNISQDIFVAKHTSYRRKQFSLVHSWCSIRFQSFMYYCKYHLWFFFLFFTFQGTISTLNLKFWIGFVPYGTRAIEI